jgi:hypothetical protein
MNLFAATWIQHLLGIDSGSIPDEADVQLAWTNAPRSWEVFVYLGVVAALIYLVVFLYRREIDTCPPRAKRVLATVRIMVLVLLAVVYLAPAITYTDRRVLHPTVVLMRDDSQSMGIKDRYLDDQTAQIVARATGRDVETIRETQPTRAELVHNLLEKDQRHLIGELELRGKLRVANFSSHVQLLETRSARSESQSNDGNPENAENARSQNHEEPVRGLPKLRAAGPATDLHKAIAEGLADRLTATVVIFTDGQHTGKDKDRANLRALAEKAGQQETPLLFVGVGDPSRPRNLQVTDVYADPQVWKDDPFEIRASLRAQGVDGQTVHLKLIERKIPEGSNESATERVIEQRDMVLPAESGPVRVVFTHTPKTAGRFAYTVRVEPVANEISEEDNLPKTPAEVKVLGEQARVLLVAGSPTWEYREVGRLLERNKTVNLSCWLRTLDENRAQEGNTTIKKLPVTRGELFEYDVVLLLDPDPIEFDGDWITLLKQFVSEHAGGMLYMAGPMFASRFLTDQRTSLMGDLLPVRMGDIAAMEVAGLLSSNIRSWPLDIVAANVDQPIMRFYPDTGATLARWKSFPAIYWSFPSKEAKPGARVLIEHSDPALRRIEGPRPLLVTGRYGSGRTVYMGFDGTWRWRKPGRNAEFFNRFWLQTTRYLVEGRSLEGKRRGTIETDRTRYEVGERIMVTARLKDAAFTPLDQPEVTARLDATGSQPVPVVLKQVPNQPGEFQATVTAGNAGRHILSVDLSDGSSAPPIIETTFTVALPSVESDRTWLDKPLLVELAEASGGRYFDVDQLDRLPAAIPDRKRILDAQSKPIPIWDTSRILLLLAGLLTVEWAVRKRFKLL